MIFYDDAVRREIYFARGKRYMEGLENLLFKLKISKTDDWWFMSMHYFIARMHEKNK